MPQPESTDRDLWVEWDEYNELIERLAVAVHQSGWAFDTEATTVTEAGEVPTTAYAWLAATHRDRRWICHRTAQAASG